MGVEPALQELYLSTVQVFRVVSTNKYGVDTYAASPDVLPARLEGATREIIRPTGAKTASIGRAILTDCYDWLTEQCDLKVPNLSGGFDWVELLNVDTYYDERGPYYQILYYGVRGVA